VLLGVASLATALALPGCSPLYHSLDRGAGTSATATSWTRDNVQSANPALSAELVASDGSPLSPAATASVTVYVIEYSGGVGSQ